MLSIRRSSKQVVTAGLRIASLGSRFLLFAVLASTLAPADVGRVGALIAVITYASLCLGLELYTYIVRAIAGAPPEITKKYVSSHLQFASAAGITGAFLAALVCIAIGWTPGQSLLCGAILACEYLSLEGMRIQVTLDHQVEAALALFARSGLWILLLIPLLISDAVTRNFTTVLVFWLGGSAASLGVTVRSLTVTTRFSLRPNVESLRRIKEGVVHSRVMLASTATSRFSNAADRPVVAKVISLESAASYSVYSGFGNAVQSLVDAGITAFATPRLLRVANVSGVTTLVKEVEKLALRVSGIALIISTGVAVATISILAPNLPATYGDSTTLLATLLLAAVVSSVRQIFQFGLFALKRDQVLLRINMSGLLVFVLASAGLSQVLGANGVALAVLISHMAAAGSAWKQLNNAKSDALRRL